MRLTASQKKVSAYLESLCIKTAMKDIHNNRDYQLFAVSKIEQDSTDVDMLKLLPNYKPYTTIDIEIETIQINPNGVDIGSIYSLMFSIGQKGGIELVYGSVYFKGFYFDMNYKLKAFGRYNHLLIKKEH